MAYRGIVSVLLAVGGTAAFPAFAGEAPPTLLGLGPDGFFLGTRESGFQLRLRGVVQADAHLYADEGPPAVDTFFVRRARPIIEGTVAQWVDFRLLPDFGQGKLQLFDAYVDLRPVPWLNLRAGKFKSPFGIERLQAEQNLVFIERGLPINLEPDRDIGVSLHGSVGNGRLDYELALLDGAPDNTIIDGDVDNAKDTVIRVFVHPLRRTGYDVGLGIAGSYGWEYGSPTTPLLPAYTTDSLQPLATVSGAWASGPHGPLAPQAAAYVGSLGVVAEYVVSQQQVARAKSPPFVLTHSAWQVAATYVLTGEPAGYNGVVPLHAADWAHGHWGAFELVARFERLVLDPKAFHVNTSAWGFGVNWYASRNAKISTDFERTEVHAGLQENAFLERIQVSF